MSALHTQYPGQWAQAKARLTYLHVLHSTAKVSSSSGEIEQRLNRVYKELRALLLSLPKDVPERDAERYHQYENFLSRSFEWLWLDWGASELALQWMPKSKTARVSMQLPVAGQIRCSFCFNFSECWHVDPVVFALRTGESQYHSI